MEEMIVVKSIEIERFRGDRFQYFQTEEMRMHDPGYFKSDPIKVTEVSGRMFSINIGGEIKKYSIAWLPNVERYLNLPLEIIEDKCLEIDDLKQKIDRYIFEIKHLKDELIEIKQENNNYKRIFKKIQNMTFFDRIFNFIFP